MRSLFLMAVLFIGSLSFALPVRETIYRTGYGSGMCDGNLGFMCIDRIKQNSQSDAARSADIDCRVRNGQLDTWSRSCASNCMPSNLPYNAPAQTVSCSSSCNFTCVIERN